MAEEFSKNQLSAGIPANEEKKVVQQADVKSRLSTGEASPKRKALDLPPAIDPRIDQTHALEFLQKSVDYSVKARSEWQQKLPTWYRQYKGLVVAKDFPWEGCSNLHIPITGIIVDTLVSRMINPIFGTNPIVTARGVSEQPIGGQTPQPKEGQENLLNGNGNAPPKKESDHEKAHDVENMLDFILQKRIQVYPIIQDWVRESLIYGRGIVKIVWRKTVRKYTRKLNQTQAEDEVEVFQNKVSSGDATPEMLEFLDQMLQIAQNNDWLNQPIVTIEREEAVYDNPDWIFIPVEDFIYHPRAIDITTAPYVGHRFREDFDDLLKAQDDGMYANVEELNVTGGQASNLSISETGEESLKDVQTLQEGYEQQAHEAADELEEFELVEFHGKYDIDGDGRMEDCIATFCPKQDVLLSFRETDLMHGKKPFSEIRMFPVPGRFECQGVCEIITDLQQELNDIHNMRIDNGTITNATMFWYDPNSDIDPEIHRPGPGVGFPAGPNQFGVVQTGDVKFSSFREEEMVRRLIQDRIGVSDFAIGNDATAGRNKTATGVSAIVNEGNQRLEMMLRNVAVGLNEAVLQTLQLVQQFGSDSMYFRIVEGAETSMRKVTAKEIQGQYDIDIAANSVNVNRLAKLNETQQQLELALRAGPEFVNVSPLIRDFMRQTGSKIADEVSVPAHEIVMRQAGSDDKLLMALKQDVDRMAVEKGLIEQPVDPASGQPVGGPGQPPQPQPQQGQQPQGGGGIDIQGLIEQFGPIVQQVLGSLGGGGGQPPPQQPPVQ